MMVCNICSSLSRGHVDADIVRRISLREVAERHKVSIRAVRRHHRHLPGLLETEAAASKPSTVFIGAVNYDVNIFVSPPVDEEAGEEEGEGVAASDALPRN